MNSMLQVTPEATTIVPPNEHVDVWWVLQIFTCGVGEGFDV